jgi:hypothetical protein
LIEVDCRIASAGLDIHFHVTTGDIYFGLIDEEAQVLRVLSCVVRVKEYFKIYFLITLQPSSILLQFERIDVVVFDPPLNCLLLWVLQLQNLALVISLLHLFNDNLAEINLFGACHQPVLYSFAFA